MFEQNGIYNQENLLKTTRFKCSENICVQRKMHWDITDEFYVIE